jgi:hypothetical protein
MDTTSGGKRLAVFVGSFNNDGRCSCGDTIISDEHSEDA